jgi:hypothetical protein
MDKEYWREAFEAASHIGANPSYYAILTAWYADPDNAERASEVQTDYVKAMLLDDHLD